MVAVNLKLLHLLVELGYTLKDQSPHLFLVLISGLYLQERVRML